MKADMMHTIQNSNGISVRILNFGGIIYEINTPDKYNNFRNIVLNYEDINDYYHDKYYIGAAIGRYANRIKNGEFKLNNETYFLEKNDGENHLHGGSNGFHKINWNLKNKSNRSIHLRHLCNEKTYPGKIEIDLIYTVNEDNSFDIEFIAYSDEDTIFNPTSHSYFNLNPKNKTIVNHKLKINSNEFLDVDKSFIPKGGFKNVKSTPFDFKSEKVIGVDLNKNDEQLSITKGYDHCFILNKGQKIAAELSELETGRLIQIHTDQPGIQLYTGNHLSGVFSKNQGLCLEAQHFPNSPNINSFPSTIIKVNEDYYSKTSYHFKLL